LKERKLWRTFIKPVKRVGLSQLEPLIFLGKKKSRFVDANRGFGDSRKTHFFFGYYVEMKINCILIDVH